MNTKK